MFDILMRRYIFQCQNNTYYNRIFQAINFRSFFFVFSAEEIECHANWRDGSFHYLVAKIHHAHVMSDEEKYRCFIYAFTNPKNKTSSDIQLAQSGDATCNGLLSPRDGSRTLTLSIGKKLFYNFKCILRPMTSKI